MNKKDKKRYSMKLKHFSDIPQGTPMDPATHPANNLADRGGVPLGQSGDQPMSMLASADPRQTGPM